MLTPQSDMEDFPGQKSLNCSDFMTNTVPVGATSKAKLPAGTLLLI